MGEISFLVCSPSEASGGTIVAGLEASGHARVAGVIAEPDALGDEVRARRVDAVFVRLAENAEDVLGALEQLPAPRPMILMSGPQDEPNVLLRAMRLGVKEFLPPEPSESDIRSSIERLILDHQVPLPVPVRGPAPLISVLGAKGGVGATSVACQLAATLQRHGPAVIADLDIAEGDVALYYDLQPQYTLADLKGETEEIDATYVRMVLQPHATGIHVLASPDSLEGAEHAAGANIERVIRILREQFDWVVLDLPRTWSDTSLRALDLSDQVLLVTAFEVPALHHARRQLELLARLGHSHKVRLIANRQSPRNGVDAKDFTRFLKRGPDACLPNSPDEATASIDQGKPVSAVAKNGSLDRAYRDLSTKVLEWCDVPVRATAEGRVRRMFRRLRRGSHGAA